jgi:hypothetical protein
MIFSSIRAQLGVFLFCFLCCGALSQVLAAENASSSVTMPKVFATVWRISGQVTTSGKDSIQPRTLEVGDTVYVGEILNATSTGETVLKTLDNGMIAVRSKTNFIAENYSAEGKSSDNFTIRLFTGSLRVISGWISHLNRSGGRIVTPSATIGIRGTDHEPFVLSAELAVETSNKEGTYDKVNRGGTTIIVGGKSLDIDPGKVGFVRATNGKNMETRALMTLLLPVLLDKVPNFYVPGKFDDELDQYSISAEKVSLLGLEQKRRDSGISNVSKCNPGDIAIAWLNELDTSIERHDVSAIIAMFASDAKVRATVREGNGSMTSVDLSRDELAQSTVDAMKDLKNYKQRRVSTDAKLLSDSTGDSCNRISLKSVVIEEGLQTGKRFRFESLEEYELELQGSKWLSIKAETTQQ